ncbi:MAG: c-type cytochrome biogenesis protein CcmI [Dehalococcoidia bacterium]|nr:c-type cytochrome biogenesis protein CcmI [Dehalococcoidia bacterium]
MTAFVALALAVLTFVFIAYPLFRQKTYAVGRSEDDRLQELKSKRETTYSMLKELEFDHQSGILTDEDYRDLEERYKRKAVSILKDIDGVNTEHHGQQKSPAAMDEIEKRVLAMRKGKGRFCAQCGAKIIEGDRFCAKCGAGVSQGEKS